MQKTGFVKALDSNCRHSENASLAARCFKVFKMDSKETALLAAFWLAVPQATERECI